MAKGYADTEAKSLKIIQDAKNGVFAPIYLLMGDEQYYLDLVCDAIVKFALDDNCRDFNQSIYYGADATADSVTSDAMSYPMMSDRRLVVLKDAQFMNDSEMELVAGYAADPMESTVLVILMRRASADKRKSLYKNISKNGIVLESSALRDYEVSGWIDSHFEARGLKIAPDASKLMAEYAGTDLSKLVVETDKLLKNLPENATNVTIEDIEKNVGISRQYSIFELTSTLSSKNSAQALKVAAYLGESPKFAMPMATAMLFTHFYRILKYGALLSVKPYPTSTEKASALKGVSPFFYREYDMAVRNYPLEKCLRVLALLEDYDYKGKGGNAGEATQGQLLVELVCKILNI